MIPVVSAGSNQVGASETCTAHVSSPSGAAGAAVGATSARSSATTRVSAERQIARSSARSVIRILLCVANSPGAKPRNDETNGTRSAADYARLTEVVKGIAEPWDSVAQDRVARFITRRDNRR